MFQIIREVNRPNGMLKRLAEGENEDARARPESIARR
jgi:hypothetical protein